MIILRSFGCQNSEHGQTGQVLLQDDVRHYSFSFCKDWVEILVSDYVNLGAKPILHKHFLAEGKEGKA